MGLLTAIADYYRLARAGATMARHDVVMPADIKARLPWPGKVAGAILRALPGASRKGRPGERFARAFVSKVCPGRRWRLGIKARIATS